MTELLVINGLAIVVAGFYGLGYFFGLKTGRKKTNLDLYTEGVHPQAIGNVEAFTRFVRKKHTALVCWIIATGITLYCALRFGP